MFSIIRYKGTYYLCEIETEAKRNERLNMDEKQAQFTYWGFKFESYITSDEPNKTPNGLDDVPDPENNCATVVATSINNHALTYAGEVDCCLSEQHSSLNNYCEIKTSKGTSINDLNFERNPKFFKWWLQSYLVNIESIQVGLRDDNGIVRQVVACSTNQIYQAVSRRNNDSLCFNFLNGFLDLIKQFCTQDDELYIAERSSNSEAIVVNKIDKNSNLYNEKYFLRDWFKAAV